MITSENASASTNGAPISVSMAEASASYQEEVGSASRSRSHAHTALHQYVDGVEAVGPSHFLPFIDAARVVAHRHLVDAAAGQEQLRRQLRLEIEADAAQPDAVERRAAEYLVGGLHVGQSRPEHHVGQRG